MKRNLLTGLLIAVASVSALTSCAKVNYEGRPLGILGAPSAKQKGIQTGDNNKFVMTEGEVREFQVEFVDALAADTNFVWTLMSKSKDVDANKRFKSINGNAVGKAGQKNVTVKISAVDVDNIRQGTQEFLIALTPENSPTSLSADLTLLDASKMPLVSFVQNIVVGDEKEEAFLELQLSEKTTEPVVVEVNLVDGSAKYHRNYNGFKTPSPNSEIKQVVVFAPNTMRARLPVIGIRITDMCDIDFAAKINKFNLKGATVANDIAKIIIPCRAPVEPPPPPPQVISLTENNKFVMSEGETKVLNLEFVEIFRNSTSFNWFIEPTDRSVDVKNRFKTISGTSTAMAGSNSLALSLTSIDIDNLVQGDQDFKVILSVASQLIEINLSADLRLIDKVKMPAARFVTDRVSIPARSTDSNATIVLNEPSTLPITLVIETLDGTALDGKDYVGFKQTFVIPPGQVSLDIPIKLLPKEPCEDATDFLVVVTHIENVTMDQTKAIVVIPSTKDACKPPPPPPVVVPKPAYSPIK
ncbi:MAG: Calx-beta domain-containing protein [Pseudobdellovibrio sp.]